MSLECRQDGHAVDSDDDGSTEPLGVTGYEIADIDALEELFLKQYGDRLAPQDAPADDIARGADTAPEAEVGADR